MNTNVVDANGDPVPGTFNDESAVAYFAGRVPAARCPHYIAASEARAGFTRCERCPEPTSLTEVLGALDALAEAAQTNDYPAYLAALAEARRCDLTVRQIKDAHWWGGQKRLKSTAQPSTVHFTWDGSEVTS